MEHIPSITINSHEEPLIRVSTDAWPNRLLGTQYSIQIKILKNCGIRGNVS